MSIRYMFAVALCLLLLALITPQTHGYAVGQSKYGKVEKFPYQVMLIGKQLWRKRVLCGGTLLDKRWILTAGHCVTGVTHFDVYMGARSVDDIMEPGRLVLRSNKFILHEQFNPVTAANDIALVKLPEDVSFSSRIRPAVLPINYKREQFIGSKVVATGWGAVGETSNSDPMQYTELRVISNEECAEEYDVITNGVICAKGLKDETVCSGDSGGPLVLKGTQVIVGITSFGPADGCETNIPGGFTRVTSYLDWIESKIGKIQNEISSTMNNPMYHNGQQQIHHHYHQQQPQYQQQYQQQYPQQYQQQYPQPYQQQQQQQHYHQQQHQLQHYQSHQQQQQQHSQTGRHMNADTENIV